MKRVMTTHTRTRRTQTSTEGRAARRAIDSTPRVIKRKSAEDSGRSPRRMPRSKPTRKRTGTTAVTSSRKARQVGKAIGTVLGKVIGRVEHTVAKVIPARTTRKRRTA